MVDTSTSTTTTGTGTTTATAANSLGVFAFGLPDSGVGVGAFLMFADGIIYNTGHIVAIGNPKDLSVQGIMSASYAYSISTTGSTGTVSTVSVSAQANGKMKADLITNTTTLSNITELQGTAELTLLGVNVDPTTGLPEQLGSLSLIVSGYRQSTVSTTPSVDLTSTSGT
jgi:hypothetical protein